MISCRPFQGDEGFTLLETVIASLAFAAIGLVLVVMSSSVIRASSAAQAEARGAATAMLVDKAIREAVDSVSPPFWACAFKIDVSKGSCLIPYAGGIADAMVTISAKDSALSIGTAEKSVSLSGVELKSITSIGEDGEPLGISVTYTAYGKEYETRACFSSFPLGASDEP
ncbi:MAG: hypothetical protein A2Y38_22745 [Spirochaetes bacterium GWB1_59_5]|nr:MAG: hypothetical protein A2Y38_22745 [Spirochaetes bacterium GWB1_59_5]